MTSERGKMTDERLKEIQERLDKETPGEIDWRDAYDRAAKIANTYMAISNMKHGEIAESLVTALAEIERLKSYEPCDPCKRDDHDNCTGDCSSNCCALALAEAEIERLEAENAELRGELHAIAIEAVSNAALVFVKDREISEHVLRADSLRAELSLLHEEVEMEHDGDNAEVMALKERIERALELTNEYLEDEDSLVMDDFTAGTCQVASEILAILGAS